MAMDGPTMADEILAMLKQEFPESEINHARKKAFDIFCTGVVQHIQNFARDHRSGSWLYSFTQEWPLYGLEHQISYSIPSYLLRDEGERVHGVGDILINYRYQALEEGERGPAFAPRFSLILPTGNRRNGTGNGVVGYQWMLPFSKKFPPRFAAHADLGLTYLPGVRGPLDSGGLSSKHSLVSYNLAASGIFAMTSLTGLMSQFDCTLRWTFAAPGPT